MKTKSEISQDKFEKFINGETAPSTPQKTDVVAVKTNTKTALKKDPNTMVYQVFLPRELQSKVKKAAVLNDLMINDFYLMAIEAKLKEMGIC